MADIVKLPKPYLNTSSFDYDGTTHSPDIIDGNWNAMVSSGTVSGINAGKYKIYINLTTTGSTVYQWNDGSTEKITLEWSINPITVPKPTVEPMEYIYDGSGDWGSVSCFKMPVISGYNDNIMTKDGNGVNRQYKAGEYSIRFALKDTSSCSWEDSTVSDYIITWKIKPAVFEIPVSSESDFVYDGVSHFPVIENYDKNIMSKTGDTSGIVNAGEYYITYDLYDKDSCTWADGSTNSKTVYWKILKRVDLIPKPEFESSEFIYDGTEHTPLIKNTSNAFTLSKNLSAKIAGEWEITVKLKTDNNIIYKWENESEENATSDVILHWVIHKGIFPVPKLIADSSSDVVSLPNAEILEFNYKGVGISQFVNFSGFDSKVMEYEGITQAYKAGEYSVYFSLIDKESAQWEDGSSEDKEVKWKINKIAVAVPTAENTVFEIEPLYLTSRRRGTGASGGTVYYTHHYVSSTSRSLELYNVDYNIMSVNNEAHSTAGKYAATVQLRDTDSCMWEDGTTEIKTINWKIIKKTVILTFPYFEPDIFIFDGKSHKPELKNRDNENIDKWAKKINGKSISDIVSGDNNWDHIDEHTEVGEYVEIIELAKSVYTSPDNNSTSSDMVEFQWEDGTTEDKEITWSITKASVPIPTLSETSFEYDGNQHTISITGFDSKLMQTSDDTVLSATGAGQYMVKISLVDTASSEWEDGTIDDITLYWSITDKTKIPIPTVTSANFVYDGSYHSPVISEYDTNIIIQEGTAKEINVGSYQIVLKLTDPDSSAWEDGTVEDKIFDWEIIKKTEKYPKPCFNPLNPEYDYNGAIFTPVIVDFNSKSMIKDGDISSCEAGTHIITISLKEDNNIEYVWDDDTKENVILTWEIKSVIFEKPTVSPTLFYYGGIYAKRKPKVEGYNPDVMEATGIYQPHYNSGWYGIEHTAVGTYYIEFILKHPNSCTWSDGSNGKITYEWSIVREIKLLEKPYLLVNSFQYDGTAKKPDIINGDLNGVIISGDLEGTEAKDYSITANVRQPIEDTDIYDYRWADNTANEIVLNWHILKNQIPIPSISNITFEYDGESHSPIITGFNSDAMTKTGDAETSAGEYRVIFSLMNTTSSEWSDGTTEDKSFDWQITKASLSKPTIFPESVMYDGVEHTVQFSESEEDHSFVVTGFDSLTMNYSGNVKGTDVGNYAVTINLKDASSCAWQDGTIEPVTLAWEITKKVILLDKPSLNPETISFSYDGQSHSPEILNLKEGMVVSGEISATEAGIHIITVSLEEDNNITYLWGDKSNTPVDLEWTIGQIKIKKPVVTNLEFTYNGEEQSPTVSIEENSGRHILTEGTLAATKAGDYNITFKIKDASSCTWEDGTTNDYAILWKIKKSVVSKPVVTNLEFTYDGSGHSPEISDYDTTMVSQTGTSNAVDAGKYSIIFALEDVDSCIWEDNTTSPVAFEWVINKKGVGKPTISNTEFMYNGGTHTPFVKYDNSCTELSGDLSGINAGDYEITASFINAKNYYWIGNSEEASEPIILTWTILRKSTEIPYIAPDKLPYNGKEQTPNIENLRRNIMTVLGDEKAEEVGQYTITIRLDNNYQWEDDSIEDLTLHWEIEKVVVSIPNVTDTEFDYDGSSHSPKITNSNADMVNVSGTTNATNAGNYHITFSLDDKEHCSWEDSTNADITVDWVIHKIVVEKPSVTNTHFVYNGGKNAPTVTGFEIDNMEIRGVLEETNAGNYSFNISLKDYTNYEWEDGTNATLNFTWDIDRKPIPVPYLEPDTFTYNGIRQAPRIINYDRAIMNIHENSVTIAREVGTYIIIIYLGKKNNDRYIYNYEWETGGINTLSLSWNITQGTIKYPTIVKDTLLYNGAIQSPVLDGFDSNIMGTTGTAKAKNVGEYKIGFILADKKNYRWEDGVVEGKQYDWQIIPVEIDKETDKPTQSPVLIYNGFNQKPSWNNYGSDKFNIGGVTTGKNAGEYIAVFTPTNNYVWKDGTRDSIEVVWVIDKLGIKRPEQDGHLYYNGREQSPEWEWEIAPPLEDITFIGETSGIDVNRYEAICICSDNCYFINGDDVSIGKVNILKVRSKVRASNTNTCIAYWKIEKKTLKAPTVKRHYPYTSEIITPEFYNYEPTILEISGDTYGIEVGDYTALFEIMDKKNYTWESDVTVDSKTDKVKASWLILKEERAVSIPYQNNYLIYDGKSKNPLWADYNADAMTLLGGTPFEINAGIYYVTFRLKNGYIWDDGTTEDKLVPWRIYKKVVSYPYIAGTENDGTEIYYHDIEGKRYPIWRNYNPDIMTMTGDLYDVDSSWHTTHFDLIDLDNYQWKDKEIITYEVQWKLTEPYNPDIISGGNRKIHIPKQINFPVEDGTTKYPEWDYYDTTAINSIGGIWENVEADTYCVILELEEGYIWEDDTVGVKTVPWKIYKKNEEIEESDLTPIHIPKQINPPFYDGTVKQPEWDEWVAYAIDYKCGDLYGVPVGTYYITVKLKTGFIWEDGTTEEKVLEWVIDERKPETSILPEDPDNPRKPEDETEETIKTGNGCCCCCCDCGIFEKLNNYEFDDGFTCECLDKE